MKRIRQAFWPEWTFRIPAILGCWALVAASAGGSEIEPLVQKLNAVGPGAAGNREATAAWHALAQTDAEALPRVLAGMDRSSPLAANWVRTAVDAIVERQLQRGGDLPRKELEAFLFDAKHAPRARRTAYECLLRVEPAAAARLLPRMLNDASPEMRRDAVAAELEKASRLATDGRKADAVALYRRTLDAARDVDQVDDLAARLERLGEKVDLAKQFGYLQHWKVIGPFDNTKHQGFERAYPPETGYRAGASYPGKVGPVAWLDHSGKDPHGMIDLNRPLGERKDVAGYASAEFYADAAQDVEIRAASANALRLWVNGKLIGSFPNYHGGTEVDQFICRASLKAGRNEILIKVCQNTQPQDWARRWDFRLRVCDLSGKGLNSSTQRSQGGTP